jgi:hypothetical protein
VVTTFIIPESILSHGVHCTQGELFELPDSYTSAVSAKVKMIQRLMKLCSSFSVIKHHKGVSYIDNRKNHIANETKGDLW